MTSSKRPREAYDQQSDDNNHEIGNSSEEEDNDDNKSSSSSSSGGEMAGGLDLGEAITREPLHSLLIAVLWHLHPTETASAALGRLSNASGDDAKRSFEAITDTAVKCTVQHSIEILQMPREALCRRAKLECMKQAESTSDLPVMWVLAWGTSTKVHGPFTAEVMKKWKEEGYFAKKKAVVSNANDLATSRLWTDAATTDF